jgi:hypothetical protein
VDLSTVTKAYQLLARIGCLRRTDPGRDPANPFQQAIAVTEVRLPRELLTELDRHPNRRASSDAKSQKCVHEVAAQPSADMPSIAETKLQDPFAGLRGRERVRALGRLTQAMSAAEQLRYQEALRAQASRIVFDENTKLAAADQRRVLQLLEIMAAEPAQPDATSTVATAAIRGAVRRLSVFGLARLKRDIQTAVGSPSAAELVRQVLWSIEEGPLRRFTTLHAIHIALKKIREGTWTRPNRLPPNWVREIGASSVLETCRSA